MASTRLGERRENGKENFVNTKETDEAKAAKFLDKIIKRVHADQIGAMVFTPGAERVTVNEILDDYVAHYRLGGRKRIRREPDASMLSHLKTARQFFGQERALGIGRGCRSSSPSDWLKATRTPPSTARCSS